MPKFRYVGDEPRIYAELPFALGQVNPGDEHELDSPPDHRWEGVGSAGKAGDDKPKKAARKPRKAAAKKPQTDQPVQAPAEPAPGIDGTTEPLAQPDPDPSDA